MSIIGQFIKTVLSVVLRGKTVLKTSRGFVPTHLLSIPHICIHVYSGLFLEISLSSGRPFVRDLFGSI